MKNNKIYYSDSVPEINIDWESGENGNVYLLKEKSRNKLMKWLIDLFGKSQYYRIHLDEPGTIVWKNINGKNTIKDIGEIVKKKNGAESFPQAEKRVQKFIAIMLKNKFVKIDQEKQGPE